MLRRLINRALRTFLPAVVLSGAVAVPLELGTAHAVGPKLTVRCFNTKVHHQVSCWTWGNSFAGGELVHITYSVTFLTMPKVNGRHPSKTFRRSVKTNGTGTFTRTPRITFLTFKGHTTYTVAVSGVGVQKDKGTTSLLTIGT
jgi:hypothetical protein